VLKKVALFIAISYTILLSVLSLIKLNVTDLGPTYKDKIFHFLAYGLLTLLWYKVMPRSKSKYTLIIITITVIIYGIIIEVLQGKLTEFREASIMDVLANTTGVIVMTLILIFKYKRSVKKI